MKILILSPHLDDAALNCTDHVLAWRNAHHSVTVLNIFTSFQAKHISLDAKKSMEVSGFSSPNAFQQARVSEDRKAMNMLHIASYRSNLVDGGFRELNGKTIYPTFKSLFSGNIPAAEVHTSCSIQKVLKKYTMYDSVIIPLGVGRHADHVLVRKCAEQLFDPQSISYYVDYPYALTISHWSIDTVLTLLGSKISILPMSKTKQTIIQCYSSQLPQLFPEKRTYFEIILSKHPWNNSKF